LQPNHPAAHFNLGNLHRLAGRLEEAAASYRRTLEITPRDPDALNNLGLVYERQRRPDEATACFRQALALNPDHIQALSNLGNVLRELGLLEEAAASCERALALRPDFLDALVNLGNVRATQSRPNDAQALYERALELDPACADAQYYIAVLRLFRLEFEHAWPGYERRMDVRDFRKLNFRKGPESVALYDRLPRWRGPGEGGVGEVAIWAEQGIGDQVLYSTLIPELVQAETRYVYEVDARLLRAYERAFPQRHFVPREDPPREELQQASRVLAAGSLPQWFRRSRADFARQPAKLLGALPGHIAHYRERLAVLGPGLKVALSWRSTQKDWFVLKKSAPLGDFAPLLKLAGVQFVDVQYGDTAAERGAVEQASGMRMLRFEAVDHTNDLEELFAILEACDLLITTSNATAHFAGALGKRTWLLYLADRAPFHYWARGGSNRSLWYPSVEIVTAPELTDWRSLTGYAAGKLKQEMAEADESHRAA